MTGISDSLPMTMATKGLLILPPSDILPVLHPLKEYLSYSSIGIVCSLTDILPKGRNPQYPPPCGNNTALVYRSPCMKHHHVFQYLRLPQSGYNLSCLIRIRITLRGNDHADIRLITPSDSNRFQPFIDHSLKHLHNIGL